MSNLPTPVDLQSLDTVTGGTTVPATASSRCAGSDPLLQSLTSLQSTLQNLGSNNSSSGGLTSTELLMFGMLMSQRSSVNVFVRRPFW
ncbi:MAG TPA: hypothetical protein VF469_32445 [Kofleriaceae bacterium]